MTHTYCFLLLNTNIKHYFNLINVLNITNKRKKNKTCKCFTNIKTSKHLCLCTSMETRIQYRHTRVWSTVLFWDSVAKCQLIHISLRCHFKCNKKYTYNTIQFHFLWKHNLGAILFLYTAFVGFVQTKLNN